MIVLELIDYKMCQSLFTHLELWIELQVGENSNCDVIRATFTGPEMRAFRASETTYFAVGQPSINLRASIKQPVKH